MPTLNSQFSFGLQQTPVCFHVHTPAIGRAADLMHGVGLAYLQTPLLK